MNYAACTIVSPNYLARARVLAASWQQHHPGHPFFILIVADLADPTPFADPAYTPVMLHELALPNLRSVAMKYDILELNTNVKPTFMRRLLELHGFDAVLYFDPDICLYAPVTPVLAALEQRATAVLTPHIISPANDEPTAEQHLLYNGTYNLGFIAVGKTSEAHRLLAWWERRCLDLGFSEGRTGLFVDQKWINLAPGLFENVTVLRDPGCNMAYWNLHERTLLDGLQVGAAGGQTAPLRFFHFSGYSNDPNVLSTHPESRFTFDQRPGLIPLFSGYRAAVDAAGRPAAESLPYGFDTFSDGVTITRLARRLYAVHEHHFAGTDPFDANGPFAHFAREQGLVNGIVAPAKSTWRNFNPDDSRVRAVHTLLRVALRLLGPHRYELLMRYLGHISVLRNQSVFLRDRNWPPGV